MNDIDRKHQENLINFEEIKEIFLIHEKKDTDFQIEIKKQFERMEPMVRAFENKRIVRMSLQEDTKTITFYVTSITSVGVFLLGIWSIIKYLLHL